MRHLFVCTNAVGGGKPACGHRGGEAVLAAVQRELLARGPTAAARATSCGCLGPCFDGPNAVLYPEGVWYGGLDEGDAGALVGHLIAGVVHAAKRVDPPGE